VKTPETHEEFVAFLYEHIELTEVEAEVLAERGWYGFFRWRYGVAGLA
jgi:hypothetical protein